METLSVILIICLVLACVFMFYIKMQYILVDKKSFNTAKNINTTNDDNMSFLSDNYVDKKLMDY